MKRVPDSSVGGHEVPSRRLCFEEGDGFTDRVFRASVALTFEHDVQCRQHTTRGDGLTLFADDAECLFNGVPRLEQTTMLLRGDRPALEE